MRPIGYRLNVEVSGIEEFKEACKEVSKKAEELQGAIDRLSIIEVELKANPVNDQTFCLRQNKKAPDGNQAHIKIIQGNYNMKNKKEQWKPRIVNIMADGSVVEDLTGYVIPAGHSYYDIILGMNKQSNEEGVA